MRNGSLGLQVRTFVEKYRLKEEVMEMQALIEEITALVQKIKAGTATLGELEAFAAATNLLNERAIVLRYKAYEAKVYGTSAVISTPEDAKDVFRRGGLDDLKETPVESAEEVEESPVAEVISAPLDDLQKEESVEIGFDLFSMDDEPVSETPTPEKIVEEIPTFEATEEIVDEVEEDEIMEISAYEVEEEEEPTFEAPETTITPELQEEVHTSASRLPLDELSSVNEEETEDKIEEPEIFNEAPTQTIVQEPVVTSNFNEHPVLRKALTNDGTLQSRLLSVRLETLKSAFGLNERLQIVKELFNGSNEAYSSAIDQLDNQAEKTSARSLVNNLAHTYSWDVESDLAVEFVQKVERRYA